MKLVSDLKKNQSCQEPITLRLHLLNTNPIRLPLRVSFYFQKPPSALRFVCNICYTIQYNTGQHDLTQYNTMRNTICFLGNFNQSGVRTACSKNRMIRAKVDSRTYGRWRLQVICAWYCKLPKQSSTSLAGEY